MDNSTRRGRRAAAVFAGQPMALFIFLLAHVLKRLLSLARINRQVEGIVDYILIPSNDSDLTAVYPGITNRHIHIHI